MGRSKAIDERALDQPVELAIRGDRMDVLGFVLSMKIVLDGEDPSETLSSRARDVADEVTGTVEYLDNMELLRRDLKRAVREGDAPPFRGVTVGYGPFDPRRPDEGLEIEAIPPLEEMRMYYVAGLNDDGFHGAGYPQAADPIDAMAMASFLRSYARAIEVEVEGRAGEWEDVVD